jgi:hydrogenase/urease accessory protein HupE
MSGARLLICSGLCALITSLAPCPAQCHRFTPGVLRVQPLPHEQWRITWRAPEPTQANLRVRFGSTCNVKALSPSAWQAECPPTQLHITLEGLEATTAEVLVLHGQAPAQVLRAPTNSWRPPAPRVQPQLHRVIQDYVWIGVQHILLGPDHLAFVLGLLLILQGWRRLFMTLTAFTAAHSLTLAAAVLGWIQLPSAPVEAVVALSIAFVAREALCPRKGPSLTPMIAAGGFGLLHGFGFAGALSALGLPQSRLPSALLSFNVGVELGQILVVVTALGLMSVLARLWPSAHRFVRRPAAYALGGLAMFWTLQRVAIVGGWA